MPRDSSDRLEDILTAIARFVDYRPHLGSTDPAIAAMAFDAVLRNLAVIGEAVRGLPERVVNSAPEVPWASIAGLRNIVVHEYFKIQPEIIYDIVDDELGQLADAIRRQR